MNHSSVRVQASLAAASQEQRSGVRGQIRNQIRDQKTECAERRAARRFELNLEPTTTLPVLTVLMIICTHEEMCDRVNVRAVQPLPGR
jgi:hypothetical protein